MNLSKHNTLYVAATGATLFLTLLASSALPALAAKPAPDFGPNVLIFTPSTPAATIQKQIDNVYAVQQHNEFGPQRNAFLFLPGDYHVDVPVGFYTQVLGLGASPNDVHITGNVHADASLPHNNATCTFWRGIEGLSVTPTGGTMQWAVSQAVPFRRMHILGNLVLHQNHGWASGGWMSDSLIDSNVDSGSQQQWISRNSQWHSWTGSNWNMVFVGIPNPPAGDWPIPPTPPPPSTRSSPMAKISSSPPASTNSPNLSASPTPTPSSSASASPRSSPPTAPPPTPPLTPMASS